MSEKQNIMTNTQPSEEDSPLLRLPGELRNKIYSSVAEDLEGNPVFSLNRTQRENTGSNVYSKTAFNPKSGTNISLLQTCKQISKEFLPFLFAATHVELSSEGAGTFVQEYELFTDHARIEEIAQRIATRVNGAQGQLKYIAHLDLDRGFATTLATRRIRHEDPRTSHWAKMDNALREMRSSLPNITHISIKFFEPLGGLGVARDLCQLEAPTTRSFDVLAAWPKVKDLKQEKPYHSDRFVLVKGKGWMNYYSREMVVDYVPALRGLQT